METASLKIRPELLGHERTDDPLYNYKLIEAAMDQLGEVEPHVERDVLQNLASEYAEGSLTQHVVVVEQKRNLATDRFESLGRSTVEHSIIGLNSIEAIDQASRNQQQRAQIDLADEIWHNSPQTREALRGDYASRLLSPAPTAREMNPDLALKRYGYDGRLMIRSQTLSEDGQTKYMYSASVFGVPIETAQEFYRRRGVALDADSPALGVHAACESEGAIAGTPVDIIDQTLRELADCSEDETVKNSIEQQRRAFMNEQDQDQLEQISYAYAAEELEFIKELAASRGWLARPSVETVLDNLGSKAKPELRAIIEENRRPGGYFMNDDLIPVALSLKQQTTRNRAAFAAGDTRTLAKLEEKVGTKQAQKLVEQEQMLFNMTLEGMDGGLEAMVRESSEQQVAESGLECSGGCPTALNQFDSRKTLGNVAGLNGEVYLTSEVKCPKCVAPPIIKKGILVDEKGRMICLDCRGKNFSSFSDRYHEKRKQAAELAKQRQQKREKELRKKKILQLARSNETMERAV